jgi:Ca2+-binding EF-hand superfamily protein
MLTDLQRRKLQLRFALLDSDGDGSLSREDFELVTLRVCAAFGHLPGSPGYDRVLGAYLKLWERLCAEMEHDPYEPTSMHEFLAACEQALEQPASAERPQLHDLDLVDLVFDIADADGNGVIDLAEFTTWMHAYGVGARDTIEAFDLLDADDDGVLSRAEMLQAAEDFYNAEDPVVAGNWLFGPL